MDNFTNVFEIANQQNLENSVHAFSLVADCGYRYCIQYGPNLTCRRDVFVKVICIEHSLRATVQRVDMVKNKVKALEKAANIENNNTQLNDWKIELEQLQRECWKQDLELYENEQLIPEWPLKQNYDLLRENGAWYMRKELAKDCADRGGCCSRSCGCCGQRHLNSQRKKGIGHCTIECLCCSTYREVELTASDKTELAWKLHNSLENKDPSFLLRMAEAYFLGPGLVVSGPADYSTSKSESWWTWLCAFIA